MAETKSKQETWRDPPWASAGTPVDLSEWITRQELLEQTPGVSEVTLVSWEKRGVLPRPIRRRRDGAPRALYPPRVAALAVTSIRQAQEDGLSLDAAAHLVRALAAEWAGIEKLRDDILRAKLGLIRIAHDEELFRGFPPGTIRGAKVEFLDANGWKVALISESGWSDELIAAAAQTTIDPSH